MTIPRYARLAAKLLQRERDSLQRAAPPTAAARHEAVAAIERALVLRSRRQRLRRAAYASLAAAAMVGLAWFARETFPHPGSTGSADRTPSTNVAERAPGVVVHSFGGGARISGGGAVGDQLGPGGRVRVLPNGRVLLAFTTGTRVSVEPSADVTLVENASAQVLALDHGALRVDVAKLAPGRRFLVHTADAEVEVHGTSFRVSTETDALSCGTRPLTRVEVFEGVVTVRNAGVERRIEKGGQWQTTCSGSAVAPAVSTPALEPTRASPSAKSDLGRGVPEPRPQVASSAPARSDLTEQNDAFAAAVSAEKAGDLSRAVRGFDALLARFPTGPLAESAAVQHLKLMHQFDHPRAVELSRDYLKRYPAGFAREQAIAILAESP